jgi:signal transduction histidine kinase
VATSSSTVELLLTPIILVGGPALAGWLLARARAQTEQLQRLTAELAAERERGAQLAAQAERSRIARDLHDILAHTLSSIAVQAGAAQQLLPQANPARQPVEHIMLATHEALDEVRSLLTTTRPAVPEDTDPRLGLDRLADLAAADGADLAVVGTPTTVQPGVSLAAFRIVQEALTNARRHATGRPVRVTVRYHADALHLEIRNAMSRNAQQEGPGGHGLIGMAERAAAYAGSVSTSRTAEGDWVVSATLPYSGARDDETVPR